MSNQRKYSQGEVTAMLATDRENTAKAFGGCTNCYGKGYHTTRMTAGTSRKLWELNPYIPCSKCDRGNQFAIATHYLQNFGAKSEREAILNDMAEMETALSFRKIINGWEKAKAFIRSRKPK